MLLGFIGLYPYVFLVSTSENLLISAVFTPCLFRGTTENFGDWIGW